ncbi:cytochrome P450 4c21-like [Leptopilina heterotoma]|uniref:cytochrome P450 4c21-like n=1 Tax=Leptopilina heterotoma TaxID=63436 RepID=UPI001CA7F80C|nr:cytochrome P450 4c21-like [Leptopilina heterotoma]
MDNSLNVCDDKITKFDEFTSRLIKLIKKRIYNIFILPDFTFNLTQLSRETYTNAALVKNILNTIIQRRRKYLKTMDEKDENCNKTLLDMLIEQCDHKNSITDEEVLQEITTIIFGSIDTTTATFSFLMLVLVTHPEIQKKTLYQKGQMYLFQLRNYIKIKNFGLYQKNLILIDFSLMKSQNDLHAAIYLSLWVQEVI